MGRRDGCACKRTVSVHVSACKRFVKGVGSKRVSASAGSRHGLEELGLFNHGHGAVRRRRVWSTWRGLRRVGGPEG